MVRTLVGDLFESNAQTLVNTVNCVGVMGKGVALGFKERFPDMYEDYVRRCKNRQVKLGEPYLYRRLIPPWILNFPTKDHWRSVSRLEDIVAGLEYFQKHYLAWGITSLAVPPLGCGEGQLDWSVVGPTLYRYLGRLDMPVELYAPYGTPKEELEPTFLVQTASASTTTDLGGRPFRINPAWVAPVEILARIEREPYHWPVGRTTFQKIAYFATESGIPTGLRYQRGSYGPFAADLKGLITRLVNNGLIREQRLGRMFTVKPGTTYRDARKAYEEQLEQWSPIIERIVDLFLRMNTQQAEVASTVYFAARSLQGRSQTKPTEMDVFREVKQWKQKRRPPLNDEEAAQAIRNLNLLGWLNVRPSLDLPIPEEERLNA